MQSTIHCEKCQDIGLLMDGGRIVRCTCHVGIWQALKFPLPDPPAPPKSQVAYLQTPLTIGRLVVWFCVGVVVGIGLTNC